jgi:hypothetical protein
MHTVIDLGSNPPTSKSFIISSLNRLFSGSKGEGFENYGRIFGPRFLSEVGLDYEGAMALRKTSSEEEFDAFLDSIATKMATDPDDYLKELDEAGILWSLIISDAVDPVDPVNSGNPDKFKLCASIDPFSEDIAVSKLEHCVKELGYAAYYASPFEWGIRANDRKFYPLYKKANELKIPVLIYTSMNYRTDRPMDIGRPLYLDQVAMDFPDMKIVAECGGWPWVNEMIGVALRHRNVYISTCSHRPKYLAQPGSGWEMFMQFGNTLLQDRVVFASGASDMGLPIKQVVDEFSNLPIKDSVMEKWLHKNAEILFE